MARFRCFRLTLATCATLLAGQNSRLVEAESLRNVEIEVVKSDAYAETVVALQAPNPKQPSLGISAPDNAKIAAILSKTEQIIKRAAELAESGTAQEEVNGVLALANAAFVEAKDHIHRINAALRDERRIRKTGLLRKMLEENISDHDVQEALENDERSLDLTRNMYQTMINFPECMEKFFKDCLAIINSELSSLGLTTLEVIVYEKRRPTDEGYNNVVIVTNELADRVLGQAGDGIVSYPYTWNSVEGSRTVGVDGKWNCLTFTPEQCCESIKASVPDPDVQGRSIDCHIFVPFGGVGNPRRNDRVIIKLSHDGRVHEAPIIQ